MKNEARVSAVRRLLVEASVPPSTPALRRGPLGTIQRKALIQDAKLAAARWSLQEHVAAFVYSRGRVALTGLDLDQLEQLLVILNRLGAALDTACDPANAPPAR